METKLSVHTIIGPWQGDAATGLMQRCRDNWEVSLSDLSDLMVATFLNQQIAEVEMRAEAEFRLMHKAPDDTEYFDGQFLEALDAHQMRINKAASGQQIPQ